MNQLPARLVTHVRCDHCGGLVGDDAVVALLRGAVLTFCDAGCHDDHVVLVAVTSSGCVAPGCDVDAVADLPYCDAHLDPAAGARH